MSGQNTSGDFVTVSIYDQTYHLRGEDSAYHEAYGRGPWRDR